MDHVCLSGLVFVCTIGNSVLMDDPSLHILIYILLGVTGCVYCIFLYGLPILHEYLYTHMPRIACTID